ncbi:unnamed protein product [Protopolystoma xenopodis]|uniref:Uncharacterized protein n=1 Tax=Protopolystoma xenopodis TaxID=117903 RepID=A0A3S5FDM0_9PLAT|nr:unnamed protein product [Protopolystoma xenopodis]
MPHALININIALPPKGHSHPISTRLERSLDLIRNQPISNPNENRTRAHNFDILLPYQTAMDARDHRRDVNFKEGQNSSISQSIVKL